MKKLYHQTSGRPGMLRNLTMLSGCLLVLISFGCTANNLGVYRSVSKDSAVLYSCDNSERPGWKLFKKTCFKPDDYRYMTVALLSEPHGYARYRLKDHGIGILARVLEKTRVGDDEGTSYWVRVRVGDKMGWFKTGYETHHENGGSEC